MTKKNYFDQVKKRVAKGDAETAINMLLVFSEQEKMINIENDIVLISSQFQSLKRKMKLNLPYDESHLNRVTLSILELTDEIMRRPSREEKDVYYASMKSYKSEKIRLFFKEREFSISIIVLLIFVGMILGVNIFSGIVLFLLLSKIELEL